MALSSKWEAQGEIYLDDGESFEFEKGAYLHRWFHFAIGRLFSSNLTPKGSKFKTKACIERIVFLGFSESDLASTYTATLDRFKKGKVANLEVTNYMFINCSFNFYQMNMTILPLK